MLWRSLDFLKIWLSIFGLPQTQVSSYCYCTPVALRAMDRRINFVDNTEGVTFYRSNRHCIVARGVTN